MGIQNSTLVLVLSLSAVCLTTGCAQGGAPQGGAQSTGGMSRQPAASPSASAGTSADSANTATTRQSQSSRLRSPDVVYVPTPPEVVAEMLRVAQVRKGDVLYDLGSGDGRIVIAAAKQHGVRGVGIDINPDRIAEANENARKEGVTNLVQFRNEDLFETDFSEATVVTLYLLNSLNEKLRPKLLRELKPGTRVVSHAFHMGDWKPEQTIDVNGRTVYFWRVPARAGAGRSDANQDSGSGGQVSGSR